jgi:drug/metabolite transporter (DMT)-like permease
MDGDPTGNTLLGCGLCFGASLGYAAGSVLVERTRSKDSAEEVPVTQMLACAGFTAILAGTLGVALGAIFSPDDLSAWWHALPPVQWLVFMGASATLLNIGWLWCTELAGASWTAMAACLSIPLAMVLDYYLLNIVPNMIGIFGAALVLFGFAVASLMEDSSTGSISREITEAGESDPCCQRWKGCFSGGRTAPLLLPVHAPAQNASSPCPSGSAPQSQVHKGIAEKN